MPFENLEVSVPSGYDAILTASYGDWHELVHGGTLHGELFINTKEPYTKIRKILKRRIENERKMD